MKSLRPIALLLFALTPAWAGGEAPRYRLPFEAGTKRSCTQSVGGALSHSGDIKNAYDFAMPEGTVIVAAMDGKVITAVDDETSNGSGGKYGAKGNYIEIQHADHTIGVYQHLKPGGATVKPGQRVVQGDPIGLAGNTGNSTGPHVHFHVWNAARTESFPITFADVPDGGVPVKGKEYTSGNTAGIPAAAKDAVTEALAAAQEAEGAGALGLAVAQAKRAARLKLPKSFPPQAAAKTLLARLEKLPRTRATELEAQAKTDFAAAARALLRLRAGCAGVDDAPLAKLEKTLKADPRFAKVKKAERTWCKLQQTFVAAWRDELKGKLKKAFSGYKKVAKKRKQAPELAKRAAQRRDALGRRLRKKRRR